MSGNVSREFYCPIVPVSEAFVAPIALHVNLHSAKHIARRCELRAMGVARVAEDAARLEPPLLLPLPHSLHGRRESLGKQPRIRVLTGSSSKHPSTIARYILLPSATTLCRDKGLVLPASCLAPLRAGRQEESDRVLPSAAGEIEALPFPPKTTESYAHKSQDTAAVRLQPPYPAEIDRSLVVCGVFLFVIRIRVATTCIFFLTRLHHADDGTVHAHNW